MPMLSCAGQTTAFHGGVDDEGRDGGGSQICTAVRLSWQPITPAQLLAMPSCSPGEQTGAAPRLALLAVWLGNERLAAT